MVICVSFFGQFECWSDFETAQVYKIWNEKLNRLYNELCDLGNGDGFAHYPTGGFCGPQSGASNLGICTGLYARISILVAQHSLFRECRHNNSGCFSFVINSPPLHTFQRTPWTQKTRLTHWRCLLHSHECWVALTTDDGLIDGHSSSKHGHLYQPTQPPANGYSMTGPNSYTNLMSIYKDGTYP